MLHKGVIGIIYKHEVNDYEFMIGNFPEDMRNEIEELVADFDDGYNLSSCRGDRNMKLADSNIQFFEEEKYRNTDDPDDVVTITEIFRRYYESTGSCDGFEKYVKSGFKDTDGESEYTEI